jgi:hypothetical protein
MRAAATSRDDLTRRARHINSVGLFIGWCEMFTVSLAELGFADLDVVR